jgi:YggT family protein
MWIAWLIDAYSLVVFVAVVLSWVRLEPSNPVVRITTALTEPVLRPVRRILPSVEGFDFSPMLLLVGLRMLRRLAFG